MRRHNSIMVEIDSNNHLAACLCVCDGTYHLQNEPNSFSSISLALTLDDVDGFVNAWGIRAKFLDLPFFVDDKVIKLRNDMIKTHQK